MKFRSPVKWKGKSKKSRKPRYDCGCDWCLSNKTYANQKRLDEARQAVKEIKECDGRTFKTT